MARFRRPCWRLGTGATRTLAAARLALLVVAAVAMPTQSAESDAERELDDLTDRLNALDTWLDDAGKRLADQQRELANADRRIADFAKRIRDLSKDVDETETTLAGLNIEQERLAEDGRRQAVRIADHLRRAWKVSQGEAMKTLLNQEDAAAADRMVRYHGYFAKMAAQAIAGYGDTLAALRTTEQAVRGKRQTLTTSQRALTADRAALVAERSKRRELMAGLAADVSSKETERRQLEESRRRLQQLVEELARKAVAQPEQPTPLGKGTLPWPVRGDLHKRFGQARAGGRMRWQGLYILAPTGTTVRAVAAGTVVFADWLRGFGLLAIVDHGGSRLSLYGYADALYKRTGERIEGGETIATVGQSGGQPEVGLYFEIRQAGAPIDPLDWLRP